jgi:peptidoglycan/LPS O-acetylase OafA/YrhL
MDSSSPTPLALPSAPAAPASTAAVPVRNPHVLPEAASLLLDIVRFSAAIVVVTGHLTFRELHTGFADLHIIGEYAVPVFFVLSGFVIRFVTRTRENTLKEFFIDRASRIYSVTIPAMALTLVVCLICFVIDRHHFVSQWGAVSDHPIARIFLNLSFLSQSWGHNTIPFVDAAFWSLSYECLYYVAYGFLFFLRGWTRVIALAIWAALSGPQVIFLFPIWFLGCWIYDLYHAIRLTAAAKALRVLVSVYLLAAIVTYLAGRESLLLFPFTLVKHFDQLTNPLDLLHIPVRRATLSAVATGTLSGILMLLALFLSDAITISRKNRWTRQVRRIADGTFAIYLMHYPLLVLALFLGLLHPDTPLTNISTTIVICGILILLASPIDGLKRVMRSGLNRWLKNPQPVRPPA